MPWHSRSAPSDADMTLNATFKTTVRTSNQSCFNAQSVDLSSIRESTLQSLLAPPLLPSAVASPPLELDRCYDADSEEEEEEPMPDDTLIPLVTSQWEDNINFGDSPMYCSTLHPNPNRLSLPGLCTTLFEFDVECRACPPSSSHRYLPGASDSPADDASFLHIVEHEYHSASKRPRFWGDFLDTKSFAKVALH